jgi:hypothetical protein
MESILVDGEFLSGQTKVTTIKNHNFLSDHWIALKFLQEFTKVVFLGVVIESILDDVGIWSCETRVTTQQIHNN